VRENVGQNTCHYKERQLVCNLQQSFHGMTANERKMRYNILYANYLSFVNTSVPVGINLEYH